MADRPRITDQTCIRCAAHAAATPTEEQLRWVMAGKPRDEAAYLPRPIDSDQHYAEQALASALAIFVDAYGIRNARARMQAAADALGRSERFEALTLQTLEDRSRG